MWDCEKPVEGRREGGEREREEVRGSERRREEVRGGEREREEVRGSQFICIAVRITVSGALRSRQQKFSLAVQISACRLPATAGLISRT
ncbi:hypothetical protein VZT92_002126 [Zoarces viviparus]|uniref:Uncharacterized protein n=1 Tax=Zoarces viviparus TaxID=48416 RepID=A0AAW1G4K8_ZOAVI